MIEQLASPSAPAATADVPAGAAENLRTHPSIPLVDLKAQYAALRDEIDAAMRRVLESTAFILGEEVRLFERAFAALCGAQQCVGLSSGTAALELALRALGVGPGDEVITVAHTFIATAEAISAVGARPVFVEIDPISYCMDAGSFEAGITPHTRAVIPVHLYGHPAPMAELCAIAARHGIAVVEDAAQAHLAEIEGVRAGVWGDIGCFSFYPGKNLGAYGDAGAITTNRADLAERVRSLRNHGRRAKYVHEEIGFGERLDTLQAAVLLAKLPHLEEWTAARRARARLYNEGLRDLGLVLPQERPGAASAWHLYVVRTPQRDELLRRLAEQGVEAGVHYPLPLHLQPAYAALGYRKGDLPVTEAVAESCLSLPVYPELTEAQQGRVIDLVRAFCTGSSHGDA